MAQWKMTVNVSGPFHDDDLSLTEKRDAIVKILSATRWYAASEQVRELVDELADVDTESYFDLVWNALYDEADADRVWIDTHSPQPAKENSDA